MIAWIILQRANESRGDRGPNKPGLPRSGTSNVGSMVIDGGEGTNAGSAKVVVRYQS